MPTSTFFRLPQKKQVKIMTSAFKEFSRVPLSEGSIANIISDADIPRGSFYQYFKDKEDIFYYLLDAHSQDIKNHLVVLLNEYQGDVILAFIDLYCYILDKIKNPDNEDFFQNIFLHLNYDLERRFTPNLEDNLNEVINLIDINKLNITNKLQLIYIIDIIEAIVLRNLVQSYKRNLSKEKNVDIFIREMNLIKEGIYKRQ